MSSPSPSLVHEPPACVLVTGAGGFIGPCVVRALLARGAEVRALVGAPGQPVRSLPPRVRSAVADVGDVDAIRELARGADVVIHMAGPASVEASFEGPAEYARVHVAGTAAVLDACASADVRRFVYVSSAEVYGWTHASEAHEDLPLEPRSPYGAAKASAEQFVGAFARAFGVQSIILRPFSVYGPGLAPHSLLGTIVRMARSEDAVVLNDLGIVRDYCYVEDLASAVLRACTVPLTGSLTVNIATGRGTSVAELAERVLAVLGRRIPVREASGRRRPGASEICRLVASVTRAREALGWHATTELESGLRQTLQAASAP